MGGEWRNQSEFLQGRPAIIEFLRGKWARELDYRLKKELWAYRENRIAVRFEYEYHDHTGQWFRAHGNENWGFAENGLMKLRFASINDLPIRDAERKFRWDRPTNPLATAASPGPLPSVLLSKPVPNASKS